MTEKAHGIKNRHLAGAGVAACAVCCAPPVLAIIGVAGTGVAATIATLAFAGLAFGIVVLLAAIGTVWLRRRQTRATKTSCSSSTHPATACRCGDERDVLTISGTRQA